MVKVHIRYHKSKSKTDVTSFQMDPYVYFVGVGEVQI